MKNAIFLVGLMLLLTVSAQAEIRHANIKVFGMD